MTDPSVPELGRRLEDVLRAAELAIASVPTDQLDATAPGRDGTVRHLAFHLFRDALAFADGMDLGRVRPEWFTEEAPRGLEDGRAIARYGALVRGRLSGWFEGAPAREYSRVIEDVDGPRSGQEFLERVTREAAERLRRLEAALVAL